MIQALTAAQTAVRGAHPTRLLLDEIDEMKLPILEAAQGQFDIRTFADVRCTAGAQTMGQPTTPPADFDAGSSLALKI